MVLILFVAVHTCYLNHIGEKCNIKTIGIVTAQFYGHINNKIFCLIPIICAVKIQRGG